MNQDDVSKNLSSLYNCKHSFTVLFTGKKSRSYNGKYNTASREIILNNRNFSNDNLLMYTAIHELAHHVVIAELQVQENHSPLFWATFNGLLREAEKQGLYTRERPKGIVELIEEAKVLDVEIARLKEKLGETLKRLNEACEREGVRYEDVIDHDLKMKRSTAKKALEIHSVGIPADMGSDMQALIQSQKGTEAREALIQLAQEGQTIEELKHLMKSQDKPSDLEKKEKERKRILKTIDSLQKRLWEIDLELEGRLTA
jgi:hypothetical protein